MPYDYDSNLWSNKNEGFFREVKLTPIRQKGPHCVSTSLAILTSTKPKEFQGIVNTQDPLSWSDKIHEWKMKFAYCPTDTRKLKFYIEELIELDDLFVLCYYTTSDKEIILSDPNNNGWVCGSHIVVLHRDKIFDPAYGSVIKASIHECNEYHTKRIFRVVPSDYTRGL